MIFVRSHQIESVDLLKIDTEGYDLEVLNGAENLLTSGKVQMILTETGFDGTNRRHVLLESLQQHLGARGYMLFGIYDQTVDWAGKPETSFRQRLICSAGIAAKQNAPWIPKARSPSTNPPRERGSCAPFGSPKL